MAKQISNSIFALTLSFLFGALAVTGAQKAEAQTGAGWTAPTPTPAPNGFRSGAGSTSGSATGSTTANATYITPGSGGGSAAESGRNTQITQLITAAINAGAAANYAQICVRPKCKGCWACPLAAMAGRAASQFGGASGGSGIAGAAMSAYDPAFGGGTQATDQNGNPISTGGAGDVGAEGGGRLPDGTTAQTVARNVSQVRSDLEKAGVKVSADGKTMTTPDGRTFDLSKGGDGTEKGLLDMGLLADEASLAVSTGKQIGANAAAKYAAMKISADGSGGGGAGGGRDPAADGSGVGAWNSAWGQDPRQRVRVKAQVSGLTKKLGDDTIGVSGDDIFEMVTRRYKARDQVNQFLKD